MTQALKCDVNVIWPQNIIHTKGNQWLSRCRRNEELKKCLISEKFRECRIFEDEVKFKQSRRFRVFGLKTGSLVLFRIFRIFLRNFEFSVMTQHSEYTEYIWKKTCS